MYSGVSLTGQTFIRKIMDSRVFSGYQDPFGHAKNLIYTGIATVQLFTTLLKPFCICYWGLVIRTNKGQSGKIPDHEPQM